MNVNELAKKLPTEPRVSMRNWITEKIFDLELGGDFCIFKREAVYIEDASNYRIICPHDFNKLIYGGANRYGADCKCTACGEHFTTGFLNKNYLYKYGIKMYCGDDGINYEGYIHPDQAEYTEPPKVPEGFYHESKWTETETEIVQEWELVPLPPEEATDEDYLSALTEMGVNVE